MAAGEVEYFNVFPRFLFASKDGNSGKTDAFETLLFEAFLCLLFGWLFLFCTLQRFPVVLLIGLNFGSSNGLKIDFGVVIRFLVLRGMYVGRIWCM